MKKIIVIFGILLLITLVGCKTESEQVGKNPFIGGSQGIVANFELMGLEEQGVETVFESEEFDVVATLKNKGEADVEAEKAAVTIKGVDTTLFGITAPVKKNALKLEKVAEFNKLGGEEEINFGKAQLSSIPAGSYYDAEFFGFVEYDYTTYVNVPKVCFKENLNDKSVCDIAETKTVYSSSAPIQVKTVQEDSAGNKRIALVFDVENVGGGKSKLKTDADFDSRYDKVKFTLSEADWDCKSGGNADEAKFVDNKATVRCTSSSLAAGTLYTKQITMQLDYIYRDIIQKTVRIKEKI